MAFLHRTSLSLILTDLVQNLEPDRLPPATQALARLVLGAPPGGVTRHMRLILRLRPGPARESLARVVAWEPERVIFAHGRIFESDGAARLRRALSWLLG